MPLSNYQK